jgi:hypothetical protein
MKSKFPKSVYNVLAEQFYKDEMVVLEKNWRKYSVKPFGDLSIDALIAEAEFVIESTFEERSYTQ